MQLQNISFSRSFLHILGLQDSVSTEGNFLSQKAVQHMPSQKSWKSLMQCCRTLTLAQVPGMCRRAGKRSPATEIELVKSQNIDRALSWFLRYLSNFIHTTLKVGG